MIYWINTPSKSIAVITDNALKYNLIKYITLQSFCGGGIYLRRFIIDQKANINIKPVRSIADYETHEI